MTEQDEKQLWMEIEHIFDSGANELRVFNMVKSFIEKRYQALHIAHVVGQSEQLKAVQKLKDFAYEVCPLHREDDLEEIVGSL